MNDLHTTSMSSGLTAILAAIDCDMYFLFGFERFEARPLQSIPSSERTLGHARRFGDGGAKLKIRNRATETLPIWLPRSAVTPEPTT